MWFLSWICNLFGKPKDDECLYVILPYFNFTQSSLRTKLYTEFVNRYKNEKGIKLIESVLSPTNGDCLWYKENLINYAIQTQLPKNWKYVAWIDADITFLNPDWVKDTKDLLQTNDVVQLFQSCVNMGQKTEILKIDKSFVYMNNTSGKKWTKTHVYGFWHPGYAWACTRKAYEQMGGLVDFSILGSGDHHMALALVGQVENSRPGGVHISYQKKLLEFQERVNGFKIDYTPGTIVHHWHGDLTNRKYQERWKILTTNAYNPDEDIVKIDGLIHYTPVGKSRLENLITQYFIDRCEL
jgi:hypothetical protein